VFNKCYKNKNVLITGHTGFKGSWLSAWLNMLGANVIGLSDKVPTTPSLFEAAKIHDEVIDIRGDIRDYDTLYNLLIEYKPSFVFHLAAQALVRPSYDLPLDTITTNAIGTANLLQALIETDIRASAVFITSDKVYDNVEWNYGYREIDRIGGKDIYSGSKGMAELAINSYYNSFFNSERSNTRIAIARAGNVIGGGDWALDRIVPDAVNAWCSNVDVKVRRPNATRPWQHVLEPLSGYLTLGEQLSATKKLNGSKFNFGPSSDHNYTVGQLLDEMMKYWPGADWSDVSENTDHLHEAGLLKLNCDQARALLCWRPVLDFPNTAKMTIGWYKAYYSNNKNGMYQYTINQIKHYIDVASDFRLQWTGYES